MLSTLIPAPYRWLALAMVGAAFFAIGWIKGAGHVHDQWDLATAEKSSVVAKVKIAQAEVTINTVTKYVDRIKIVRAAGETIIKEIPRYVPPDTCTLPAGFRLLHDTAAGHDPDATGIADAAPVAAATVAETLVDNYTTCLLNAEQLIALQDWALKQSQIGSE